MTISQTLISKFFSTVIVLIIIVSVPTTSSAIPHSASYISSPDLAILINKKGGVEVNGEVIKTDSWEAPSH